MSEKFLAIQTAFPGDAILTLPALQVLKEKHPTSTIDVVAINSTAAIFESSPIVNQVNIFDKKGEHKSLFAVRQFALLLRKQNYTKVFSFHRSLRTSILVYFMGAYSVGYSSASLSFLYQKRVKYVKTDHEVKRNLALVTENAWNKDWQILPRVSIQDISLPTFSKNKSIVAIAPGSVWQTKKLPTQKFQKIISYFVKKGTTVLLIGAKDDKNECDNLAQDFDENVISVAGKYSIPQSIQLLKMCSLLICNDSAPTHMGMCADIPVLTIYCSTVPEFGFYPYNKTSKMLSLNNIDCKPCGIHGHSKCPKNNFRCGDEITHDFIIKYIESMID